MFKSARLKLTAWYVLIAFLITAFFSILAFGGFRIEFERGIQRQRAVESRLQVPPPPPETYRRIDTGVAQEIRDWLLVRILIADGLIIFISAISGWFLAGRALKPIKVMVDEQNRFVSDASHELRTPLTALMASIEVGLRDKTLDLKKAKELLEGNLKDVKDLQKLSEGLLSLAVYNANGGLTILNLKDVLGQAKNRVESLAKLKKINIEIPSQKYSVKGDEIKLIQLFVILLDNAIKYSPDRKIIKIKIQKTGRFVKVFVIDQGPGIPKEDLAHIFDRFYRTDKARTKRDSSGFGLGLSIAKKIAKENKGSIAVESEVAKGSTFIVSLLSANS